MLHTVRTMLTKNNFVHIFSFDFSKAFGEVRKASLTTTFALLKIPDCVFNWVVDISNSHAHCVKYVGLVSAFATICASVIWGLAVGPAFHIVAMANLNPVHA